MNDSDLREMGESDLKAVLQKTQNLTAKGRLMLQDAVICAAKVDGQRWNVTPFTRYELGLQVGRKQGVLNPYDLRLVGELVTKLLLIAYREPLPAKTMVGVDGDDLTVGAGWQYVYTFRKRTLIGLLALSPRNRATLEKMRGAPFSQLAGQRRW